MRLDPSVSAVVLAIDTSHLKPVRPGVLSMCVFALSVVVQESIRGSTGEKGRKSANAILSYDL